MLVYIVANLGNDRYPFNRKGEDVNQFQNAFKQAGLISERQSRELETESLLKKDVESSFRAKAEKEKKKRMEVLSKTTDPDAFRREAHKILLLFPEFEMVSELLALAYKQGMNKERKGSRRGSWLIANLNMVKNELLAVLSEEDRRVIVEEKFLKK